MTMAASVEPKHLARLEPSSAQMQAFMNGTRAYPPPSPRRSDRGFTALVSSPSHPWDEDDDDDEQENWRKLYGSHLQLKVVEPAAHDRRDEGTADAWVKRNPSLIRLTGKHPLNCEPPLARLLRHGFITPAPLHYVRNHGAVPRADWAAWTVEVAGLVRRPAWLTMEQLARDFPAAELPVTLVCSSNRRGEQNAARQTLGFNWGPAAVSTSVWRGARLRDVLRRCGIAPRGGGALNVCFEGADCLPGGGGTTYGTSIRREWAMDPAMDVMLAYMQNGEPLLPDHGFPVRVIVPGCTAGRMVKWLRRIVVTTAESDNYYHYRDNRFLPSHVDAELADAEGWWYKPEHVINEMNINSVITTPGHDEILPVDGVTTQRGYTMKGYAYSGGGKKVTRVEVTLDAGWLVCELNHPEKPTKYGKHWCFWSVEVEVLDLLGAKEIAVRAWDQSLNTQPEKLVWNLMGMMNNCWFRVKVNVCQPRKGEIGLVFEHPTQPGNQPGGWMARQKRIDVAEAAATALQGGTPEPPTTNTAAASERFTMAEVREHASRDSAWIVVRGSVYDCTTYLEDHPGGANSILINAGTDCTEEFDAIHSDKAKALLGAYRIGELITTGTGDNSDAAIHCASSLSHLDPIPGACRLVDKKELSRDVRLFRFAVPSADKALGLPVGKHILVCADIDGKLCARAYTPTSAADEVGHFELLVKVYLKGEHPKFPDGGLMTQYLDSLPIGSCVDVKGPLGHVAYAGRGEFVINGEPRRVRRLAMVAGGSGIAPMYQVIQEVLRDQPEDRTAMHLVSANRTEEDILLRGELDRWAAEFPDRLKVWYVVDQVKRPEEGWEYSVGFLTEDILREHVPKGGDDALALACGPPAMIQLAVAPNLEKMKYQRSSSFVVF
ncbi:hypothetical protein PVAP13_6NG244624 [Panicum virgatum]|uniref:Nitrate reductase n=1 Tax=Panicum virgatum TaxID=38727 RepID=A0A8T0R215_PANVG|nr:hypothetical protein PVAP13_6NG244624 [Panicum virgatum]